MGLADTNEWDLVVQKTYGLQPEFFESGDLKIKFYVGSSFFFRKAHAFGVSALFSN